MSRFLFGMGELMFVMSGFLFAKTSFMFGIGCCQPITMMLTFTGSAEGRSGEALGLRLTVNHLTRVLTPVIFGSIGSIFGLFAVFWGNAALLGGGGVVTRAHGGRRAPP